ncbi:MAG TPA: alpha/beta fold hydrolase, partial [Patescibacteria group bacterium]|nr:alpha/beta fold hydrolase [Patescibacteria group bacterium]
MKKQPALFVCLFAFLFLFSLPVYAITNEEVLFEDNFTSLDNNVWNVNNTGGRVYVNNGITLTANGSRQFPFISLKNNYIPPEGDYFIDINYEFPQATNFGVGFGIGNLIPTYGISQSEIETVDKEFVYYQMWRGNNDLHSFQSRHCPTLETCDLTRTTLFQKPYVSGGHSLEIKHIGNDFVVFADGLQIVNPILLNSGRRPSTLWIGNPVKLDTPQSWTSVTITSVKIGRIIDSKIPIIIIPGFAASWNYPEIARGEKVIDWRIPPFIKDYDSLKTSLINSGYVDGENLFTFAYDWRKPLDQLADNFKAFLDSKNLGDQKINIISHSMGGLVARAFANKYGISKINKIVTAGTPHLGTPIAYGLWEGTVFWDNAWWEKALPEFTTFLRILTDEPKIVALRRVVPAIKDLMPTYDFLQTNGVPKPWSNLFQKNDYLKDLNSDAKISGIDSVVIPFGSSDGQAIAKVNVTAPSIFDLLSGRWEDGSPTQSNPFVTGQGDGTITGESAKGLFTSNPAILSGDHENLLANTENIKKIFNSLGIDTSSVSGSIVNYPSTALVAVLRSPGTINVCDENGLHCNEDPGIYLPDDKVYFLPGYDNRKMLVKVS